MLKTSDEARATAAKRKTFKGGAPITCYCATCKRCKKRATMQRYRANLKERTK